MAAASSANPVIQKWESLMWTYQLPTPWTPAGEKWVSMARIFSLAAQ
jgi:L-rhamnose mutarotase